MLTAPVPEVHLPGQGRQSPGADDRARRSGRILAGLRRAGHGIPRSSCSSPSRCTCMGQVLCARAGVGGVDRPRRGSSSRSGKLCALAGGGAAGGGAPDPRRSPRPAGSCSAGRGSSRSGLIRAPDHRRAIGRGGECRTARACTSLANSRWDGRGFTSQAPVISVKKAGDPVIARCEAPALDSRRSARRGSRSWPRPAGEGTGIHGFRSPRIRASALGAGREGPRSTSPRSLRIHRRSTAGATGSCASPQDGVLVSGVGGHDPVGCSSGAFVRQGGQMPCAKIVDEYSKTSASPRRSIRQGRGR